MAMQKKVLKRTKAFDADVPVAKRSDGEARDEASEISRKQGRVKQLTRKLADKLNKTDN